MTTTQFVVQLPSHSFSFPLSIPSSSSRSSTILDLKQKIYEICPGNPKVVGQRVILRGKVLGDSEFINQVFKEETEIHTVHLAVHPSAWTNSPPNSIVAHTPVVVPKPPQFDSSSATAQRPMTSIVSPTSPTRLNFSPPCTPSYINFIHANALRFLGHESEPDHLDNLAVITRSRDEAKFQLAMRGIAWPDVFDRGLELLSSRPEQGGVMYEAVTIDNLPYYRLIDPSATPTPLQLLAIEVLTYSFPLLTLPPISHTTRQQQIAALADMFLGPRQAVPRVAVQINLRPLIVPLFLLTLRTTLLLYFFSPVRRPVFGTLLALWVVWEVWVAVRAAVHPILPPNPANNNPNPPNANANNNEPAAGGGGGVRTWVTSGNAQNVVDRLARINLVQEESTLFPQAQAQAQAGGAAHHSPAAAAAIPDNLSLFYRVKAFLTLFFITLHPAVWERRQEALRERETKIRLTYRRDNTEGELDRVAEGEPNRLGEPIRPGEPEGEAPPAPLPTGWVGRYVERVQNGFADD